MHRTHGNTHGHSQSHTHGHPPTGTTVIVTSPQTTTAVTPSQPTIPPFNPYSYANNAHGFHYHAPQPPTTQHTHSNSHTHSHPPSSF